MQYQTTINDEVVFGITAAREAYNATLPAEVVITPASEGQEEVKGPNPAILNNDALYLDFVLTNAVASWCRQYAPVAAPPETPPVVINGVPQTVTRRQAKTLMELTPHPAGNLWLAATAAAESIPDAQTRIITMNYLLESLNFEYVTVLNLAQSLLGMTAAQVDQLFIEASKL